MAFRVITSCNELPAVFVLLREGRSGVTQSHWEVLSQHSLTQSVHKHPFCSLSKLHQPHTARVSPGLATAPLPLTEPLSRTPSLGPTASSCSPHMPGWAQPPGLGLTAPCSRTHHRQEPPQGTWTERCCPCCREKGEFWKQSPLPAETLL